LKEGAILEAVAREMRGGVLVVDGAGLVLYANPFFMECFSLDMDLRGRAVGSVIGESDLWRAVCGFMKKAGAPAVPAEEMEISEKGRCFSVRTAPLGNGNGGGLMIFLNDITEEKRVEAIKKDFVANVSHELRTPLASIKGYSETLLDGGMDDKRTLREFLRVIDRHATRMSHLIEDLLILSRLESHPMAMVTEPLDICELAGTIAEGFRKQAADKGIELAMGFASGERPVPLVLGDRVRLEQVMVNLLDNAIKYTPAGGRVRVEVTAGDKNVRVDVADTGIGIPASDIPRIFERFYRVDKARSRELGGTGLGLAIVKHIVHGLNGRVWVESAPSKGSRFSFTLRPVRTG